MTARPPPTAARSTPRRDDSDANAKKKDKGGRAQAKAEAPKETTSQENARETAENYLDYSHFSRSGLIQQLTFEGYTRKQAEYGVNKVGL
jgi:hypothetical protein